MDEILIGMLGLFVTVVMSIVSLAYWLRKKFAQIDERFDQIDAWFERIDEWFVRIDAHFKRINKRFASN